MESAKLSRRSAKGKLNRANKTVIKLLQMKRPASEVYEALTFLKSEYKELSDKHVAYCQLLTDNDLYDEEERWMEVCWEEGVNLEVAVNDYISSIAKKEAPLPQVEANEKQNTDNQDTNTDSTKMASDNPIPKVGTKGGSPPGFKLRKEFLPTFTGDVREYAIFQSDFQHIVDSQCSDRDAITLLRSCLTGKPAELIRGIKNDYRAAWEYLDSVYGDARYVADAITNDLASFECLIQGEDTRFCDLVHLVRRSYNTLNELGRSSDMDNNHVLAMIEGKMCVDDRRNWCRDLVKEQKPATLAILLDWMTIEMRARMRSSAPLRNAVQTQYDDTGVQIVNHVAGLSASGEKRDDARMYRNTHGYKLPDKCWLCHNSDHWTDQCTTMHAMSPEERWKTVQENHGCYSCLKRAGRQHTLDTCYRRRKCGVISGGKRCTMYHHSLLHGADNRQENFSTTAAQAVNVCRVMQVKLFEPVKVPQMDSMETSDVLLRWKCHSDIAKSQLFNEKSKVESTIDKQNIDTQTMIRQEATERCVADALNSTSCSIQNTDTTDWEDSHMEVEEPKAGVSAKHKARISANQDEPYTLADYITPVTAPATSVPATPVLVTLVPVTTSVPVTPVPVTPIPVTPVPVTPVPVTPVPVTPVSVTVISVTPVPVTTVPARPVPVPRKPVLDTIIPVTPLAAPVPLTSPATPVRLTILDTPVTDATSDTSVPDKSPATPVPLTVPATRYRTPHPYPTR